MLPNDGSPAQGRSELSPAKPDNCHISPSFPIHIPCVSFGVPPPQSPSTSAPSLFGFTRNEFRVVAVLGVISLLLAGAAILRPLLWPTLSAPPLAIIAGDGDEIASRQAGSGVVDPDFLLVPVTAFVIDPNTSPADSLELLPGVGRVIADRIVTYRARHPFTSPLELLNVNGIGPTTYERLRPFVRINPLTIPKATK